MCDDLYGEMDALSRRLEPLMTKLAKACLTNKPDDLDQFCYTFFANRLGVEAVALPRQGSSYSCRSVVEAPPNRRFAADDDLDDDEEAIEADYTAAIIRAKSRKSIVRKTNYESSDDENEGHPGSPLTDGRPSPQAGMSSKFSRDSGNQGNDTDEDDIEGEVYKAATRVNTMNSEKSKITITSEQTQEETVKAAEDVARIDALAMKARDDTRMKTLFDTWDADGGGTVDLVELVVAMHKFNRVMEDGSGLKRATEALLHNDNDESQELDITEFTRFVVHFCDEAYGKSFDEMAAHMLAVACSSSERAALAKASGHRGVDQIIKDDEEEIEVLKETVRGVEASVVENISKIKTSRRVMFQ